VDLPAPLAATVEIHALDTGARRERVWRLSRAIGEAGLGFERDLPFERGRPVRVELTLPDEDEGRPLIATGVVETIRAAAAPDDDRPLPRAVAFTALDPEARQRVVRYVEERRLVP
jgi:hypothetical protein